MDKSVDSIGSCSLDVDADSSEKSDTSGSLNFPTPISIKDITRDFVANINERCAVRKIETSATLMNSSSSQTQTISTQPTCAPSSVALQSIATEVGNDKKPSYLNLACCVNGYSNITTYDSKIRQDINKSREVSPIRPSTSSIQHCKKNDFLAPPKLRKIPKSNQIEMEVKPEVKPAHGYENGHGQHAVHEEETGVKNTSFIQQQMERLYGPAALAQGFYSPKKVRNSPTKQRVDNCPTSELKLKFKELSPSKDYSEFRRKINGTGSQTARSAIETNPDNNNIDLPVLRHLSQEFRAQLPKISPKRSLLRSLPSEDENASLTNCANGKQVLKIDNQSLDEVDHKNIAIDVDPDANLINSVAALSVTKKHTEPEQEILNNIGNHVNIIEPKCKEKDGHYFIKILKAEEARLLSLASDAEKYIEELSNRPEVGEEIFGFLRSASGKARLLVSQKMKQFEGLCHKNINYTPGEVCRTTADDLQGFWDMVYLQVEDINTIFDEVEKLKANNWKQLEKTAHEEMSPKKQYKNSKINVFAANGSSKTQKPKSAAALERESQRKQKLLEIKRQKKLELAAATAGGDSDEKPLNVVSIENPVEIFINENKS